MLPIEGFDGDMPSNRSLLRLVEGEVIVALNFPQKLVIPQTCSNWKRFLGELYRGGLRDEISLVNLLVAWLRRNLRRRRANRDSRSRAPSRRIRFCGLRSGFRTGVRFIRPSSPNRIKPVHQNSSIDWFEEQPLFVVNPGIKGSHVLVAAKDTGEKPDFGMEVVSEIEYL